jgi:pilus assembly protein CpaE
MSTALVVSRNPRVIQLVQQSWGQDVMPLMPDVFPPNVQTLLAELGEAPMPGVVILDPADQIQEALFVAADLDQSFGIPVVLVSDRAAEIGLAAMRSGVRDIVHPMAPLEEMKQALDRAASHPTSEAVPGTPGAAPQRGKVVTVASPKGGVGKTTVATNLAVGLALSEPNSTVLVDLDIHFGDVGSALNISPEFTLPDMAHGPASRDSMALKSYLTQHQTGLFVVPGSDSPAAADAVAPKEISNLLAMLAGLFKYVVVDTAPGLGEHTLSVLDLTDVLVLVTSLDVPGVRGLRKELDTLRDISIVLDSRFVVLNFMHPSRGLSVGDVEASIGRKVDFVVPQSNSVPISTNQGIPLLQQSGKDPVVKQFKALVDRIAAGEDAGDKGRRFLDFAKKGDKK